MRTVLLFDIDGTLVLTGGAGRRAMVGAFGNANVFDGLSFAGMTDRAIVRYALKHEANEEAIDRFLERYVSLLEHELRDTTAYQVLPGVAALLAALDGVPDVAVGLGTGNIRRGAYAKLTPGSLHGSFAFGGFGCDAEDRTELLRAGLHRGAAALGARVEDVRCVVIGDTPKDVAAAKGIGARCVGVGTGGFAPAELLACGAERAFATLAEPGVREALFE